jgi:hypothetical protein
MQEQTKPNIQDILSQAPSTHAGMKTEEFELIVEGEVATAKH